MKIAYLGFDFFSNCFDLLINEGHEIVEIFSYAGDEYNSSKEITNRANQLNIPIHFHPISNSDILRLEKTGVELIVSAAYPYKIPIQEIKKMHAINIHPSLLPEGRGPWPLPHFILKSLSVGGVSIHAVSDRFDAGDVLVQEVFKIDSLRETLESISMKVRLSAQRLLLQVVSDPERMFARGTPQVGGSYWSMPTIEEQTIDWNQDVDRIDKVVRAFGKLDSVCAFDGKKWLLKDANVWEENHNYVPGQVVLRSRFETLIAAKDGFVCLRFFDPYPSEN